MVRISNPNPKFNWPNRTEQQQKTWLLVEKTKKTVILISIKDLRMVVHARQNCFSPKNRKNQQILHRGQNIHPRSLLQRDNGAEPYLLCPRHQYCQVQSKPLKVCFFIVFFEEIPNNFFVVMKAEKNWLRRYIHNMSCVNNVSTKPDIWNFGKTTKKSRFSLKEMYWQQILIFRIFVSETCQTFTSILLMVLGMWYCLAITDDYKILQIQTQIPHIAGWKY